MLPYGRAMGQPVKLEVADEGSSLSLGLGVVESSGDKNQVWSVFPVRVSLRSGNERLILSLSGLDLLARVGGGAENGKP